jgi:hypothetical protein
VAIDDRFEKVPELEPKVGEETINFRLNGSWLVRWKSYMELAGNPAKSDVLRECLTLLFACASTDAQGKLVQVVLRRDDEFGRPMADVDLVEYLNLPSLQAYRLSRKQSYAHTQPIQASNKITSPDVV